VTPETQKPAGPSVRLWSRDTLGGMVALGCVTAILAAAFAVNGQPHPRRLEAIGFAASVALLSAAAGWLVSRIRPSDPANAVALTLAGTLLRLGLPLVALGWLLRSGHPLREAGADGLLVGFYLALLASALILHKMVEPPRSREPPG
jgi:hypothetical protein